MKKLCVILLLSFCVYVAKAINGSLIEGQWHGDYDGTKMILVFKGGAGSIKYFPQNKVFKFSYHIRQDSMLVLSNGKHTSRHLIKQLTHHSLRLLPYHGPKNAESIDMINAIEFKR